MRLNNTRREILGVYEPTTKRIIIRRDQLATPTDYCGTLIHELTHVRTGTTDGTLAVENALTQQLGALRP